MRSLLLVAFAAAAASPAFAQTANDEIVVTATGDSVRLADIPARVDVIDRADIEAQGLTTLTQTLGASAVQSGGFGQTASVFLRGTNSKHTLALFDGVRLNDGSLPNAQYNFGQDLLGGLDRVEIYRGPDSAVWGSDAIGGVVNMIPRSGGDGPFNPFLEASIGELNTRRGILGATGSSGGLDYGVSAEIYDTDGFDLVPSRMTTHTGDPDSSEIETFTGVLKKDFGSFSLDALARVRESDVDYDFIGFDDPDLTVRSTQSLWRLGGDWRAAETLGLRLSGGQVRNDSEDRDGGVQTTNAESTRDFADASADWTLGAARLRGGLSWAREQIDVVPSFGDVVHAEEDQHAAYALADAPLGGHLRASGSVRVDDYEGFGAHTTYRLGLVGQFAPLRVYASYGTAFKAPALMERFGTSAFNVGNPDLDPEESESWEIGADVALESLRFGASYYQTNIDNLIDYDFFQLKNINVGEAAIDGAEAYAEYAPGDWLAVRLSYAWTDAENAVTHARLLRRPENVWTIDAGLRPTQRLGFDLTWSWIDERVDVTYDNDGNFLSGSGIVPSYDVGAIAATFDLDAHAQIFVRVDNVSDATFENPAAYANQPRTASIGIRVRP